GRGGRSGAGAAAGGRGVRRADAGAAGAVRAHRRVRRRLPPACRGPGPVPPRAPGRGTGGGGQRRGRAARARRVQPLAPAVRGVAQAPRALALLLPFRGAPSRTAGPCRGVRRDLGPFPGAAAAHVAASMTLPEATVPIIPSLLDTDLYKLTMMQAVLHQHPGAQVEYLFRCRSEGVDLVPYLDAISDQIDALCALRATPEELDYLRGLRFLKPDFVDFLGLFHFDRKYVQLRRSQTEAGGIELRLRGPWLHTIMFEVPLLAIISELYMTGTFGPPDHEEGRRRLRAKTTRLGEAVGFEDCVITDFGTRRRYSHAWHGQVLPHMRAQFGAHFAGTSNVHFARTLGLVPQGTMAHEWLQAFQA